MLFVHLPLLEVNCRQINFSFLLSLFHAFFLLDSSSEGAKFMLLIVQRSSKMF